MTRLTTQQVLSDKRNTGGNRNSDPEAVTLFSLTHKALSDASCLSEFQNLERLDLAFNNLTSLEGLRCCVNLKWLSVVQNKLQSLKGVEALSKLTVLNVGKNKLKSMEEVQSIGSLRALILNDNEIASICRLDQMKELNTLVLSRNPIREIGDYLSKVKSIMKLSLSNCQLQAIDSSLKSCIGLKELRLAHNDIKTLPAELAYNKKLQNLDLGNNVITRWSDVKVLSSLVNLKNLNLLGNPIAEKDKLAKKVKNFLPNLRVFNAKPLVKGTQNPNCDELDTVDKFPHGPANKLDVQKEGKNGHMSGRKSTEHITDANEDCHLLENGGLHNEKDLKKERKRRKGNSLKIEEILINEKDNAEDEKGHKRKKLEEQQVKAGVLDKEKYIKQMKEKTKQKLSKNDVLQHEDDRKRKSKNTKKELGELDIVDDPEASFADLVALDTADGSKHCNGGRVVDKVTGDSDSLGGLVISSSKNKKMKKQAVEHIVELPVVEIGMGGPSTWGDD